MTSDGSVEISGSAVAAPQGNNNTAVHISADFISTALTGTLCCLKARGHDIIEGRRRKTNPAD